ncbi:ABC transporter ATP-binding protein [Ruficoccus sp. ZRK36]|uniref:ABC transporter ATP-binding protein n=1 Tax=Ruficoccus sp. ZRK36 TaxID=2866311 RepID=UPI001C737AFB|nr:ABC transporter ATP-binding protein [Ruficoccus sp. ZRK36]QYY34966.1 ABC transporter ATP-binding protein [Ruficoccus sp. ZRK36]
MSSEPVLQTVGLTKVFTGPDSRIEVLSGVDLSVHAGESVSIRGESGAGKTTLLYILSTLELPDAGAIHWSGENVLKKSADWRALRRTTFMGLVFQSYYLIPEMNALENVLMAARLAGKLDAAKRERARDLLAQVGLSERLRHMPGQLSGGERQRVALARALLNKPALVLADEPTGNLDEHTGAEVMDIFMKMCAEEQVALCLVTHNPEFASRTQRRLFMRGGVLEEL